MRNRCLASKMRSSPRSKARSWFRYRRATATWGSSSLAANRRTKWSRRCAKRIDDYALKWPPPYRWSSLSLRFWRHVTWRQRRAFAEEIIFHLLEQEFLRFLSAEVQPVLVHDHLHLLQPHLPGFLGDALIDALAERMAIEGRLVEPRHFLLEFDAEDFASAAGFFFDSGTEHSAAATHGDSPLARRCPLG